MDNVVLCGRCGVPLECKKTEFQYLGHYFYEEVPRCPKCGQVYIDRALAEGKMAEVEQALEEK